MSSSANGSTSIIHAIQHYQRSLERCQKDEPRLLHCIHKLYNLPIKVEHLQVTGIGKTVNSLRKFEGEIGTAAKALVTKWKTMVAEEEVSLATAAAEAENIPSDTPQTRDSDDSGAEQPEHSQKTNKVEKSEIKNEPISTPRHKELSPSEEEVRLKKERNSSVSKGTAKHHKSSSDHSRSSSKHKSSSESKHRSHSSSGKHDHEHRHHKSKEREEKRSKHKSEEDLKLNGHEKHKGEEKRAEDKHKLSSTSTQPKNTAEHSSSRHKEHSSKEKQSEKDTKEKSHATHSKHKDKSESSKSKEKHAEKNADKHKSSKSESKSTHVTPASDDKPSTSAKTAEHKTQSRPKSEQQLTVTKSKSKKSSKKESSVEASDNEIFDEGIDSSMGTNFADVLGMIDRPSKKSKAILSPNKRASTTTTTGSSSSTKRKHSDVDEQKSKRSKHDSGSSQPSTSKAASKLSELKPDLLAPTAKLEPLDPSIALELPTISTNYKPMPLNQTVMECVFATPAKPRFNSAEAMAHGISSKTMRTKIYSGVKTGQPIEVPSLFNLCIRVLQKNIDALEYTGGVPFEILRPVLERATPQQLLNFEEYNPYLMEDSDELWRQHVQRHYRCQKRMEMETWREMFMRCQDDQERKLNLLAESIKISQKLTAAPVRRTQLAFVDSMVKPPRNVQRKQEQFGTKSKVVATPAARVAALSNVTPNAVKLGDARLRVNANARDFAQVAGNGMRPKKAPLMAKTLQLMRRKR